MIDKQSLMTLQRLYDSFAFEKVGKTKVFHKDLGPEFLGLQNDARARAKAQKLYKSVFQAFSPESLQDIIVRSNSLVCDLVKKYGDFTSLDAFMKIDSFDQMALSELADDAVSL
jgi:hypothetical protein